MKQGWMVGCAAAIGLALAPAAFGQATSAQTPGPWTDAQTLQAQELAKLRSGGVRAIAADTAAIEAALAAAPRTNGVEVGGQVIVLVDGSSQALFMMAAATAKDSPWAGRRVAAVADPYPFLALLLGSYYDEVDRPTDALRVLDLGLALPSETGLIPGQIKPSLMTERGAALVALHDWPRALAAYEAGLALPGLSDVSRAKLLRGRGMALTELGRLDEAESAYNDSLKLEPANETATHELAYLARLRAGGSKTATGLKSLQPPAN